MSIELKKGLQTLSKRGIFVYGHGGMKKEGAH
jgi:hypothetical protein